jgi:hypothetical protein
MNQDNTPRSILTPEEQTDPLLVFEELFDFIDLSALQECMWLGLKTMVTGRYKHLSSLEKDMQLEVYERLKKAVEAMYVVAMSKD